MIELKQSSHSLHCITHRLASIMITDTANHKNVLYLNELSNNFAN